MRQPEDMALPERPEPIYEYRAALMSVFLNTLPKNDPARLLVPSVQPLTLSEAISWIHRLPDRLQRKATAHAAYRLAVATFVEGREKEFAPWLVELLGVDQEKELRAKIQFFEMPTSDLVFAAIYEPLRQTTPPAPPTEGAQEPLSTPESGDTQSEPRLLRSIAPLPRALPIMGGPPPEHAQSTLDLDNLTTTVWIQAPSLRDFTELRRILDPRNWHLSPFWPESYRVELAEDGATFERVTTKQNPGDSWHGNLFEHVEWNWNTFTVSSFRNYLNIDYEVSEQPRRIRLSFSLYSCDGSTLFVREARNGVDVDRGFLNLDHVNSPPGFFHIDTQKIIRFSDVLDRRMPLEGPLGSGQILSFMAPAVVGLWMHDLLSSLYFPE